MHAKTFIEPETEANGKLRLFSVYVDFAASVRARWAAGKIAKLAGPRWKTSTEMWALDFFQTSQPIRDLMLQGAADFDVLIIALSSLDRREVALIEWLNALAGDDSLGFRYGVQRTTDSPTHSRIPNVWETVRRN